MSDENKELQDRVHLLMSVTDMMFNTVWHEDRPSNILNILHWFILELHVKYVEYIKQCNPPAEAIEVTKKHLLEEITNNYDV